MRESIDAASKMLRHYPEEVKAWEKIERKFGYDVIDHKNYNEIEPER